MAYFSRRNNHVIEYSGHEEASEPLRKRLLSVLVKYVDENPTSYANEDPWSVEPNELIHEVQKEFPGKNPFEIVREGQFHEVFTVVEIFLDLSLKIYYTRRPEAHLETAQAFALSGSVYDIRNTRVVLRVDAETAKQVDEAGAIISGNPSASEKYFTAVGDLFGRKAKPEDIVKDIFIAFEDYLKDLTEAKDYGGAVALLQSQGLISSTQKALLEKIYAYRSDTYGVGHAGNGLKPDELDAMWFLETVGAQIRFIGKRKK